VPVKIVEPQACVNLKCSEFVIRSFTLYGLTVEVARIISKKFQYHDFDKKRLPRRK
jgi:hypothetical protein